MSDLDPLLQLLFEAERTRPDPPADARARVLSRVAATVGLLPPGGGGGHGGGHGSLAPVASVSTPLLARPVAWLASAFIAGGFVGAGVHASIARPQASIVQVAAQAPLPVPPVAATAPAQAVAVVPVDSATASAPGRAPTSSTRAHSPPRDVDLAEERALLEVARTALARGQDEAALHSLEEHAARFPNGRLSEEREVLTVQALASSGRTADARDRAARFRHAFPQSILLPAVDAALAPIP